MGVTRLFYDERARDSNARLALKIRRDYTLLDLRDLDASWPTYLEAAGYSVRSEWRVRTSDALLYLFQTMLDARNPPVQPLKPPLFSHDHVASFLRLTGPIYIKRLIAGGWEEQAAYFSAARQAVLSAQNHVNHETELAMQEAAEEAEDEDGRSVVQGYKRIASPTACAFCRRLAGATEHVGLVYNVTTKWRHPHNNCRCKIEPQPVYKLLRIRQPEEMALTAEMYAALRRERDEALREALQVA